MTSSKDPKNYYSILGLSHSATSTEIKAAFKKKAVELHPDRNKSPNATREFQMLNEAYGVLSDPVLRAKYDTSTIDTPNERATSSHGASATPEPIVCSACGCVTAQPRYVIFWEIKSFIFVTTRTPIQGIFCSTCAEKKAYRASAVTWVLGWWGVPWGFFYSIHALFNNLFGGAKQHEVDARLAAHQAWYFAYKNQISLARSVAKDALDIYSKIKIASDEGLRSGIEKFLELSGGNKGIARLKNSWRLLRRPFYVQAAVMAILVALFVQAITKEQSFSPQRGPKPYVANPDPPSPPVPSYIRPATAPNGKPWPVTANYISGFKRLHTNGLSTVTIDNGQNDNDAFVKIVSVSGPKAYPVRVFFIPAHGTFTAKNLTAGDYDVRYRNLDTGRLTRSDQFTLEEIQTEGGRQYSTMTMTLYKVPSGNMKSYSLAEEEF